MAEVADGAAADARSRAEDPSCGRASVRCPTKQRAAVVLRYVADLSHAEVAAALGCSEEAARRSLHEGTDEAQEGRDAMTRR